MEEKKAKLFVNAPNALEGNEVSRCDTAAAAFQSEETGLVDMVADVVSMDEAIRNPPPETGMRSGDRYLSSIAKVGDKVVLNIEKFFQSDLRPY